MDSIWKVWSQLVNLCFDSDLAFVDMLLYIQFIKIYNICFEWQIAGNTRSQHLSMTSSSYFIMVLKPLLFDWDLHFSYKTNVLTVSWFVISNHCVSVILKTVESSQDINAEYSALEESHRDRQVQLLSKSPIWGPKPLCY